MIYIYNISQRFKKVSYMSSDTIDYRPPVDAIDEGRYSQRKVDPHGEKSLASNLKYCLLLDAIDDAAYLQHKRDFDGEKRAIQRSLDLIDEGAPVNWRHLDDYDVAVLRLPLEVWETVRHCRKRFLGPLDASIDLPEVFEALIKAGADPFYALERDRATYWENEFDYRPVEKALRGRLSLYLDRSLSGYQPKRISGFQRLISLVEKKKLERFADPILESAEEQCAIAI